MPTQAMQTISLVLSLGHIAQEAAWTVLLILASIWLYRKLNEPPPGWTPPDEPLPDEQGEQGSPVSPPEESVKAILVK